MNRRELLTSPLKPKSAGGTLNPPTPKPKRQDFSHTDRTQSDLTPYTGQWTLAEVKHLLRRVMFGSTKADADYFVNAGMTVAVAELLTVAAIPVPPLYTYSTNYDDPNVPFGQTWVSAPYDNLANGQRTKSFKGWWTSLMLNQNKSITEKMTLFWMNHFSTEINSVGDARYSYATNALCRQYALGSFKTLTRLITLDPGMLKYLNGYLNKASAPDENYGRELQELFTVGKDANGIPFYSEADVQAAAHTLTGYRIDSTTVTSYFDSTRHDTNDKTFSAFYNNTVITGQSGPNGANELDDLLNMIFATDEVALFLCRKLYRFFVYYEIDAATETNVIVPLATIFRNNNYEIQPVLSALFGSEHFYDVLNRGCIIKAPLDLTISFCREMGVVFPDTSNLAGQYNLWYKLYQQAALFSQSIGDPPNVAGWPAYYQEPQYHELWINTGTLPFRNLFTDTMIYVGYTSSGDKIIADVVGYTGTLTNPEDPNLLIQEVIDRHYSEDVSQTLKDYLKSILLNGQITDDYWTDAWNNYVSDPTNMTYYTTIQTRLQYMFKYIMDLSEFQLA
jgi:uncharacterized protein (DUF1800 family)